jgi:hypothetical protein
MRAARDDQDLFHEAASCSAQALSWHTAGQARCELRGRSPNEVTLLTAIREPGHGTAGTQRLLKPAETARSGTAHGLRAVNRRSLVFDERERTRLVTCELAERAADGENVTADAPRPSCLSRHGGRLAWE